MPTMKQLKDLETLADSITLIPNDNFDMDEWVPYVDNWRDPSLIYKSMKEEIKCGTSCCVYGWASILFSKNGFGYQVPNQHGDVYKRAFASYFGITDDETHNICYNTGEKQQEQATRIRAIVARYKEV